MKQPLKQPNKAALLANVGKSAAFPSHLFTAHLNVSVRLRIKIEGAVFSVMNHQWKSLTAVESLHGTPQTAL